MLPSKLSILEHLRQAAVEIYSWQSRSTHFLHDLCESELATLIHQYYQSVELDTDSSNRVKRRIEEDSGGGKNKKFRSDHKENNNLTALELLPNEIYEKIIQYTDSAGKKSLRVASKWLYHKTTLMSTIFQDWTFYDFDGCLPDFVLKSDKLFNVKGYSKTAADIENIANLANRFSHRISSLKLTNSCKYQQRINWMEPFQRISLMNHIRCMKPSEFPNLISLDLHECMLDNQSLLHLAPQLESLKLCVIDEKFDLSLVHGTDRSFTKLKTLVVFQCKIDVQKILKMSHKTLEYLELEDLDGEIGKVENLQHDLSSLKYICLKIDSSSLENTTRNLLFNSYKSLKTLILFTGHFSNNEINFSSLVDQPLLITNLELKPWKNNFDKFLDFCPHIQKLTLHHYDKEVSGFALPDLTDLRFNNCTSRCMTSVLQQVSKSSKLKTLNIDKVLDGFETEYEINIVDELKDCDYPRIQFLDTVKITIDTDIEDLEPQELEAFVKLMFPSNSKVSRKHNVRITCTENGDIKDSCTELRRVYNIQD